MHRLFGNINITDIVNKPDFKEDSVREVIILPILHALGYTGDTIVRSKTLNHPFLKIGSNKKLPIQLIPDYALTVQGSFAWVLDAKAPNQNITNENNLEQVYSYAAHPEIRSVYFALCNGVDFVVYRREATNTPVLHFAIANIEHHWVRLCELLAPTSFQAGKQPTYQASGKSHDAVRNPNFDYAAQPLLGEIVVKKRAAKRHFGVHGYFTKQAWNVVAEYITHFSQPGDMVLDPFGGSGVTAVEALMNNRRAINIDINPLAVFLVESLVAPVEQEALSEAFLRVQQGYEKHEPNTKEEITQALQKYPRPRPLPLPKGSDVDTADQLFSDKQTAQLGLLKWLILKEKDDNIRKSLLLMFSSFVTRINLTFHTTKNANENNISGGEAAAFRYYRYRIAPSPKILDVIKYFPLRFQKVAAAKMDMHHCINAETIENIDVRKGSATDLHFVADESIDYIYTDPPYGNKIPYLDLSVMWHAWLDLEVSEDDYNQEVIEGGEHEKSKDDYNQLMAQSIQEMYRVLKFDRWMSLVFAHKDPEFWHLIIETAESCGFEYVGAVPQRNGQTSFKKRQNPFTVLSGQLIINFRKVKNPKSILTANLGMDIAQVVIQTIEGIIAKESGATLEQINDELVIKGLELGFLDLLKKEYTDLTPLLLENFDYDEESEHYSIKKDTKFKTHVDVRLRVRYYLLSYLRRKERENKAPHFDDIVLHILPLLKNGVTPENQTILSVLEDIAEQVGEDRWKLIDPKRIQQTKDGQMQIKLLFKK